MIDEECMSYVGASMPFVHGLTIGEIACGPKESGILNISETARKRSFNSSNENWSRLMTWPKTVWNGCQSPVSQPWIRLLATL